ncbi:MAG: glutamine synthetase [Deltaproteobacteria bacterium]|nr:glutamine synthetase [Deltaproteobacteria bacterium]
MADTKSDLKEGVLRRVRERGITGIWVWFIDIIGQLKGIEIARGELEDALDHGLGFDGSSVEGFARIEESDLMAIPDPVTFAELPVNHGGERLAQMFCDLVTPEGEPYPGDSRQVLKRALEQLAGRGWRFNVGAELEYFYFGSQQTLELFDSTGYFDASLINRGTLLRQKTVKALESMGVRCEYSHHEVAPSQHEIDVRYMDGLRMADTVMIVRYLTKEIARENDAFATFLPKPLFGQNGSGMHTHQSLFEGDKNLFYDATDPYNLSPLARSYIAGLLRHIREITLVLNQTVNSYKRLVPGYEAPAYICWGQKNRSTLVRVPRMRVNKENSARCELRSPDPVCNPYLSFACMLAAGLRGIDQGYQLPPPVEKDIFHLDDKKRGDLEIATLPGNLYEAILLAEKSALLRETLGDHIFDKFIHNKKIEWDQYRIQVTDYELKRYLPLF